MIHFTSSLFLALLAVSINGAPIRLTKRIAQNIPESTAKWEQACLEAGGAQACNPVSVAAFSTLLAAAGPCAQQDAADNMIDLAKKLGNDPNMITLTQLFVQQPRNSPSSESVQYCQSAPRNDELNGLFQCQFEGTSDTTFVGGVPVGQPGTIPFALKAPVSPPGTCPASPDAAIADGTQLNIIPGISPNAPAGGVNNGGVNNGDNGQATVAPATTAVATTSPAATQVASGGFKLQNGKDAQALNAKFATLTATSPCAAGENACVNGGFAQCVAGQFAITQCGGGLTCFALPLVNSPGTSITCDTEADATARFAASGVTGGVSSGGAPTSDDATSTEDDETEEDETVDEVPTSNGAASTASSASGFQVQNGKDAQALNAKFATLTENSTCTSGDVACIDGAFAQCSNGKFAITPCGATLTCVALPLVNKPGTSVTCDTQADALARLQAAGVSGGLTG